MVLRGGSAGDEQGWREVAGLALGSRGAVGVLWRVVGGVGGRVGGWLLLRHGRVVGGRRELLWVLVRGLWPVMCRGWVNVRWSAATERESGGMARLRRILLLTLRGIVVYVS